MGREGGWRRRKERKRERGKDKEGEKKEEGEEKEVADEYTGAEMRNEEIFLSF